MKSFWIRALCRKVDAKNTSVLGITLVGQDQEEKSMMLISG